MCDQKKTPTVVITVHRSSPKHEALMDEVHRQADHLLAKEGFRILSIDEVSLDFLNELAAEKPR